MYTQSDFNYSIELGKFPYFKVKLCFRNVTFVLSSCTYSLQWSKYIQALILCMENLNCFVFLSSVTYFGFSVWSYTLKFESLVMPKTQETSLTGLLLLDQRVTRSNFKSKGDVCSNKLKKKKSILVAWWKEILSRILRSTPTY